MGLVKITPSPHQPGPLAEKKEKKKIEFLGRNLDGAGQNHSKSTPAKHQGPLAEKKKSEERLPPPAGGAVKIILSPKHKPPTKK